MNSPGEAKVTNGDGPAAVIAWDPEPVAVAEMVRLVAVGGEAIAMPSKLQRGQRFLATQTGEQPVQAAKLEKRAAAVEITKAAKELGIGVGPKDELAKSSAV